MSSKSGSKTISPQAFMSQWENVPSEFDFRFEECKREMGEKAVGYFKKSFEIAGFKGSGSRWPERKHVYPHQILRKTGSLEDSIVYRSIPNWGLTVMTDESRFPAQRGSRNSNSYAVFHNDPTGSWRVNQYSDEPAVQRQFIGHSKELEDQLHQILGKVFRRMP